MVTPSPTGGLVPPIHTTVPDYHVVVPATGAETGVPLAAAMLILGLLALAVYYLFYSN